MPIGELAFANILDSVVRAEQGDGGPTGIDVLVIPGRALPFVIYRGWRVSSGIVIEEIRFTSPSGRAVYTWGPQVRRMTGSASLSEERDTVSDAVFEEEGKHTATFLLNGEPVGELTVPIEIVEAPASLPKGLEVGLKRSDVVWVGDGGKLAASWFAYRGGRIYLLSQKEPGPEEQTVPGIPGARELLVVTRRKGRETALDRFHASVRVLESGPEYEAAANLLVDRRRSRVGPPEESLARWRDACVIVELTPIVPV